MTLRDLWNRFFGGREGVGAEAIGEAVEYKGYRIRPAPYSDEGQFQTAGIIEKDSEAGLKEHRFVRAEKHASRDEATTFSVTKGKQIIDERGDAIFEQR